MNLFYQKNFLKLLDFTPAEISDLLALAAKLKAEKGRHAAQALHGQKCRVDL